MISIPGVAYANPGVFSEGEVLTTGLSIPANQRVLCIVGEGKRREVLVNFAAGNGQDGFNPPTSTSPGYTTSTGSDGRHFTLSHYPLISNRLELYKNGVLLSGVEDAIDTSSFSYLFDYRVDINLGHIELQTAHLVDQGGAYYRAYGANVGNGTIDSLTLEDVNAPTETWSLRCSAVRRDIGGNPIDGYAKFVANGSVSGVVLDGYGAPVLWQSDGTIRSNGILSFAINEGTVAFEVGDNFIINVESGVLSAGDNLTANYIATLDINDPELFIDMDSLAQKHGTPSTTNTLSLGAQLAFANGSPGVLACQAAPGMPRRSWFTAVEQASGNDGYDDCMFPLPAGVIPDADSDVKFLVINTVTGAQTQILPNKVDFYNPSYSTHGGRNSFINTHAPYSYTVIMSDFVKNEAQDATITVGGHSDGYISSDTITFDLSDIGANIEIEIYDATHPGNNGWFTVLGVSGGVLRISGTTFAGETSVRFREYDTSQSDSAYILITKDLYLSSTQGLSVGVIDERDASFYDANWTTALEKLESFELDILNVFPTQTKSAIIQSAMQHCLNMSRIKNRKERVLFTGAIQGLTPDNVTGVKLAAVEDIGILEGIQGDDPAEILAGNIEDLANYSIPDAFGGTYRCVYHYPDRIVVALNGSNTYVDGMYLGAAHGGLLSATGNVAIPSTNKTLAGFSILRDRVYSTLVSENITKAGITLVEPVLGGGRIVWGKTTSQSGYPEEEEISIVFIRDKVAKSARLACQGFIGQPESPTFPITLQARINSLCLGFVSQELITKYANIVVKRDDVDPRQWNVRFAIMPVYPIDFIYIKFSLGII